MRGGVGVGGSRGCLLVSGPTGRSPLVNERAKLASEARLEATTRSRVWLLAAACIGVTLRVIGAVQPLNQPVWRQSDLWAQARGFLLEDANPFHPRIAWRGNTSGLAESEFPLVPWTTAMLWRIIPDNELWLRLLPFASGLMVLWLFWMIAKQLLDGLGATIAFACIAVAPLAVFVGSSVQSDGVMLAGLVGAVCASLRWTTTDAAWKQRRWPLALTLSLGIAGLMKPTALHVGVVVAAVIVVRRGWQALSKPVVALVATTSVALPLAWMLHARSIFRSTGLSLGISNEHHFAGTELLTNPSLVRGIIQLDLRWVWGLALLPAMFAVFSGWRSEHVRIAFTWAAAAAALLLIVGRTTGDEWAFYYHVVAVPPMALLVGTGCSEAIRRLRSLPIAQRHGTVTQFVIVGSVLAMCLPWLRTSVTSIRPRQPSPLFVCAQTVSNSIPEGLLLTSGGIRFDDAGHDVAHDAPYMFHWLDRQGWTLAIEDQSVSAIDTFRALGARFFVAETQATSQVAGFDAELQSRFPVIGTCTGVATVYDLGPP